MIFRTTFSLSLIQKICYTFSCRRFYFLFLVILLATPRVFSQNTAELFGTLTDSLGRPVLLANIAITGTTNGAVTDENGKYSLVVPAGENIQISFSYIGFNTETISLRLSPGEKREINRKMHPSSTTLPGLVIEERTARSEIMTRLDPKMMQVMPNPSGNIENILKTLPGVSSSNELSSQYNVRGGNYDENLVYVNDVEIYRPFLIRSGQQEGLSFVNSDLVSSLNFSAGGFDAKYGDKMSSVLDIKYMKPNDNGGFASMSLLGESLSLHGTNAKKNWTGVLGMRQKSNQYVLKSLDTKGDYKPSFTDVQTYITHAINKKWEIGLLGNFSRNKYKVIPQTRETEFGTINQALRLTIYFDGQETDSYETMLGAITATNKPNDKLTLKFISSVFNTFESETFDILGQYKIDELERDIGKSSFGDVAFNRGVGSYLNHARNYLDATVANLEHKGYYSVHRSYLQWGLKAQHEFIQDKLNEWTMIDSAGYSLPHSPDSAGYQNPSVQPDYPLELYESVSEKIHVSSNRYSGYLQNTFSFSDSSRFSLTAGVRANYWEYSNELVLSPRAALSYKPKWKRDIVFRAASGFYYQPPFYKELRDLKGVLNPDIKAQRSIHFVLGSEYSFTAWGRPFKYVAEIYYKYLDNLIPYKIDNVRICYFAKNEAHGYARGVDMRVNGEFVKGIESWASVSFLQTKEDIENDFYVENFNSDGEKIIPGYTRNDSIVRTDTITPGYIPRLTDQRINFGLFFQDYLPKFPTYKMHLTLLFGSGLPFGPPGNDRYKDKLKMPPYRRVDIGFSKQILGGNSRWNPHRKLWNACSSIWISAEVFNLLQVSNTVSYTWITDITNRQYAVPNYLTSRQLNVRLNVKF